MSARGYTYWTSAMIRQAGEFWMRGLSAAEIARKMGVSTGSIHHVAAKNRDLFPQRHGSPRAFSRERSIKLDLASNRKLFMAAAEVGTTPANYAAVALGYALDDPQMVHRVRTVVTGPARASQHREGA